MKLKPLPLLIAGTLIPAVAHTEEPITLARAQLDNVVVSATRVAEDPNNINRPLDVVTREDIESQAPQSVPEALRFKPNVSVTGGPRSGSQEVNIRGLSGEKVLQSVDGVRQVFESGHRPSYFLDPELIKSIEVIKGPASSLWGSGAVGGVVAQNTINGTDLIQGDNKFGGFAKLGRNSNSNQMLGSAAVGGRGEQSDWLLSGYHRDADDLKLGNGQRLSNSAFRSTGVLGKFNYHLDNSRTLSLNYREAEVQGGVPSNGSAVPSSSNFLINRDQTTRNLSAGYQFDSPDGRVQTRSLAYWNEVNMDESRQSDGRGDATTLDVYGFSVNQARQLARVNLQYGVDGYQENFRARRSGANRPIPPDGVSSVYGAYIKGLIPLNSPLSVELAARYDQFDSEAKNLGRSRSDNALSPSAALIWKATEDTKVALRHDRAFRAPGAEELFSTGTHFSITIPGIGTLNNTFVPNPNLRPEQAANTELQLTTQFKQLMANDQLKLSASVFQNKVKDFIEQIVTNPVIAPPAFGGTGGTTTWVNVNRATLEGFELSANYLNGRFSSTLGYGQVRGRDEVTGRDLTNIPGNTVTLDSRYVFVPKQVRGGVRILSVDDQNRTNTSAPVGAYGGYTLVDLYVNYQPQQLKNWSFDFTIKNAGDKAYRQAWAQLDNVGREAIVTAKITF